MDPESKTACSAMRFESIDDTSWRHRLVSHLDAALAAQKVLNSERGRTYGRVSADSTGGS
jgi:hypothetical protein